MAETGGSAGGEIAFSGGFTVHLEMGVDSKHCNVGFLALSGRSKVGHPRSAHSHKRT